MLVPMPRRVVVMSVSTRGVWAAVDGSLLTIHLSETQPNGQCGFCQYANGDAYGRSFNVYYSHLWRDYGFFWAYGMFSTIYPCHGHFANYLLSSSLQLRSRLLLQLALLGRC